MYNMLCISSINLGYKLSPLDNYKSSYVSKDLSHCPTYLTRQIESTSPVAEGHFELLTSC